MHQLAYVQAWVRIAYTQDDNAELLRTLDQPTYSSQEYHFDMEQLFFIRDVKAQ